MTEIKKYIILTYLLVFNLINAPSNHWQKFIYDERKVKYKSEKHLSQYL